MRVQSSKLLQVLGPGLLVAATGVGAGDLATAGLMLGRAAERDPGNEAIAEASRYVQGLYEVNRQIGTDTGQPQQPSFAAVQNSVTAAGMMVTGGRNDGDRRPE